MSSDTTYVIGLSNQGAKLRMAKYYFTFGYGHKHPATGKSLAECYTIIEAPTAPEARVIMEANFGTQWSMQYSSPHNAGIEEYGLKLIPPNGSVDGPISNDFNTGCG